MCMLFVNFPYNIGPLIEHPYPLTAKRKYAIN